MAMIEVPNLLGIAQAFTQGQRDRAEIERGRMEQEFTRRKMEDVEELRTARKEAQGLYASGDIKGARTRAVAGGDFDFVDFMNKADESQQAAIAKRAEVVGNMAQWADTPEKWDNAVDQLIAMGYGDLASQKGRFSPEARMAAIAASGQVKDYFERTKPVNMSPGGRLVDPTTGRVIAQAPFAPWREKIGEGETLIGGQEGGEGTIGGYDTVLGDGRYGQPPAPLTQMSIGQAIEFGKNVLIPNSKAAGVGRDSRGLLGSSAMGAYQITQSTLQEFAPQVLGPDWQNQQFTPEVQDAIAEAIFNSTGRDPAKLQARWASLNPQEAAEVARMPWEQARRVIAEGESGGGSRVIAKGPPKTEKPETRKETRKASMELRKEFNNLQEVKDFKEVHSNFKQIYAIGKKPNPSAQDDIALTFSFMKMLDPSSVVRETEYATAQNATGVPEQIRNQWNRLLDGNRLNPAQRREMVTTAGTVYKPREDKYNEVARMYHGYAMDSGLDPNNIAPLFGPPKKAVTTSGWGKARQVN